MRLGLFIIILILCNSCSSTQGYSDIELTWKKALVFFPSEKMYKEKTLLRMEEIKINKISYKNKMPLLLYLHGCSGLGDGVFLQKLSSIGIVIIAPDSFARSYRPMQCNPKTKKGGKNLFIYDFRSAELTYALEKISEIPWIDFNNLFLFGASEGGVTAALFRGNVFNGRVITQWTCTGAPLIEGIDAPKNEPILSIVKESDPWYASDKTISQDGNCGSYMLDRLNSKSIILKNVSGEDPHNVFTGDESLFEIKKFIRQNIR
ncbi:MAG: hypothetical protein CMM18_02465 [Rhodospirillaceae bacterium]|nr:hypothetical protein [Rhodospirillaceae bacterium]|tara:strand:+ start:436 stop:1221 length:786 start_codon:yes stop_codon:yes gene_type:complete